MKKQADLAKIADIVSRLEESYSDHIGVNLTGEDISHIAISGASLYLLTISIT